MRWVCASSKCRAARVQRHRRGLVAAEGLFDHHPRALRAAGGASCLDDLRKRRRDREVVHRPLRAAERALERWQRSRASA